MALKQGLVLVENMKTIDKISLKSAKYTGYTKNGKMNGSGIFIREDGAIKEGQWKNDNLD